MHSTPRAEVFGLDSLPVAAVVERLDRDMAAHGHDFLELALVRSGTGNHDSADGSVALGEGTLLAVRPGAWHAFSRCRGLELMLLFVGTELLAHELSWLRGDPRLGQLSRPVASGSTTSPGEVRVDPAALAELVAPVAALARPATRAPGEHARRLGELLRVFGILAPFLTATRPPPAEVAATLAAMEADPALGWTLGALAAIARCSPSHLARLYRRHLGAPPMHCLGRLRAERAASALLETDDPVAEVGRRVGWPDPAYASRRFRSHFGMSPTQYRRRLRG